MLTYFKLVLMACFWGGTFVAGRILTREVGPFSSGFLRFAMASVCLVWLMRRYEGGLPRLERASVLPAILLGLTGVFAYNACFFWGLKTVHAGRAAVIVAINPMVIAVCAALLFREPFHRFKAAGMALAFSGAALAIGRGRPWELLSGALTLGDMAILGCVASWVCYSLIGKVSMRLLSPKAAVTWSCLFGALALFPFAVAEGLLRDVAGFSPAAWGCLAYLAVCGTVLGFTWYYEGVKQIGAARAAVFINVVPLTALFLGWFLLGEPFTWPLALGGAMVVAGVVLANRRA